MTEAEHRAAWPFSAFVPFVLPCSCCECTCVSETDDDYRCGQYNDFACVDPAAPCVDDDDITIEMVEHCDYVSGWLGERDGYLSFVVDSLTVGNAFYLCVNA